MSMMASRITRVWVVCSTVCSGQIEENIKALRHWPLWGKSTGDQWIPITKGQWRGKCFHLMKSSCDSASQYFHDDVHHSSVEHPPPCPVGFSVSFPTRSVVVRLAVDGGATSVCLWITYVCFVPRRLPVIKRGPNYQYENIHSCPGLTQFFSSCAEWLCNRVRLTSLSDETPNRGPSCLELTQGK